MKIAAIDIGSNAVRLLINEVKEAGSGRPIFTKLNTLRIPLRLGGDVLEQGEISDEKKVMLINIMKIFADLMSIYQVQRCGAFATSAMREAQNSQEIIEIINETSQVEIKILSGDEEAELMKTELPQEVAEENPTLLYIDVGGGSTELMYIERGEEKYRKSFGIGAIRMLDGTVSDGEWEEMKREIKENITEKSALGIGVGGNINKIFSMSKPKDGKPLSVATLKKFHKELSQMTLEERLARYDLTEDRADIIVPALELYLKIMGWAGGNKILVPKISIADGMIKKLYEQAQSK